MEGMGVDTAVVSVGEEKFRGLHVEVVLIEGGRAFALVTRDCIWEEGGASDLVKVDEPSNPWMEAWQGLR